MVAELDIMQGLGQISTPKDVELNLSTQDFLQGKVTEDINIPFSLLAQAMDDVEEVNNSNYRENKDMSLQQPLHDGSFLSSIENSPPNRPLAEVVAEAFANRMEQSEVVIRTIAEEINQNNAHIASLNDIKKSMLEAKEGDHTVVLNHEELDLLKNALGSKWEDYIGIPESIPGGGYRITIQGGDDASRDANYEIINTSLDNEVSEMNSLGQMTMIDLQSSMDKFTNAVSALTNFLSKIAQSDNAIVGNMR